MAAGTLRKLDVAVDLVYVDASHEAEDVAKDLRAYWDVVRAGGVLFGDDYAPAWPGVVKAVDAFAAEIGRPVEHVGI
jgi:predicted O-methyltransferase YrrM